MKDWLAKLDPRERALVVGGAAALVILFVYLLILQPLYSGYAQRKAGVSAQQETVQWMLQSAHQVKQLKQGAPAAAKALSGRSLLSVADSSARAAGLGDALKRVEPEGSDSVRVWLDGVSFDSLAAWLGDLNTRNGIDVSTITIERQAAAGRVNARLTLQAPKP